ncbi:MAG: hypothetical protein ACLFUK_10700 [Halanaerobium sp.]
MDTKEYFNRVTEKLENMSDEEFLDLLKKSGIDDCPLRDDIKGEYQLSSENENKNSYKYSYKTEDTIKANISDTKNSNLLRAS